MIESYKKAVDNIKASEELEEKTIRLITEEAKGKTNRLTNIRRKRISYGLALAACLLLVALGSAAFYREVTLSDSKVAKNNKGTEVDNSKTNGAEQTKIVKEYAAGSVQSRIMKEEPVSFDSTATVDKIALINRNIKDRYANSQNVIKGYVYSTEYFWNKNEMFSDLWTKSVIVVEKSYKGQLKPGDKFVIFEHGGVTTLKDWIENTSTKEKKDFEVIPENYDPYQGKDPNTLIDYAGFFGIKTMRPAQEVVLFLVKENYEFLGKNGEPGYRLVEGDGGKMVLENGRYQTKISPDDNKSIIKDESCAEYEIDNLIKTAQGDN